MKTELFKKLIKEAVKEAFNEELKGILLEAIKAPSKSETITHTPVQSTSKSPTFEPELVRNKYTNFLKENFTFTTNDINTPPVPFRPPANTDTVNGTLPPGEVSMEQIFGLINNK
jgi:hypothetical protein